MTTPNGLSPSPGPSAVAGRPHLRRIGITLRTAGALLTAIGLFLPNRYDDGPQRYESVWQAKQASIPLAYVALALMLSGSRLR